jgi:hypothetical protein
LRFLNTLVKDKHMNAIRLTCMIMLLIWLNGCSEKAAETRPAGTTPPGTAKPAPTVTESVPAIAPAPAEPATTAPEIAMYKMVLPEKQSKNDIAGIATPDTGIPITADKTLQTTKAAYQYAVKVQATRTIKKNLDPSIESAGQLQVWVGQPGYEPPIRQGMNAQTGILPPTGTDAISAKITPEFDNPLAFGVEPKESECQKVEPQGTEVSFKLIPKMIGEFRVGASVRLYGEKGCLGDIITRTAEPIAVKVVVGIPPDSVYQEIWTAFMKFFKEILAICTALLLFLFRNKLKKLFSPDKNP